MRRFFLSVIAIVAVTSMTANAQIVRFGVQGGFTSSNSTVKNFDTKSVSLYQLGMALNFPIAAGFAIQPALVYQMKGTSLDKAIDAGFISSFRSLETKVGFLELPVQIQWGPDLVAFRPYVFAEPFIGIGINTENTVTTINSIRTNTKDVAKSAQKRLEYGLGIGAGLEFWKIQVSARYFWNFGSLYNGDSSFDNSNMVANVVKTAFKENKNFSGVTASVVLFF